DHADLINARKPTRRKADTHDENGHHKAARDFAERERALIARDRKQEPQAREPIKEENEKPGIEEQGEREESEESHEPHRSRRDLLPKDPIEEGAQEKEERQKTENAGGCEERYRKIIAIRKRCVPKAG